MIALQNPFLQMQFNSDAGTWGVTSAGEATAALEDARIGISFRAGRNRAKWILRGFRSKPFVGARKDPLHGRVRTLSVEADADFGLSVQVEWSLPVDRPFLLWRVILTNRGSRPLRIDTIDLCAAGARFGTPGGLRLPVDRAQRSMFVNGWQSWSFAGGRRGTDRQPGPKLGPINSAMHIGTLRRSSGRAGHFVSDMFTEIGGEAERDSLVAGFLAQREQFGFVETWLTDETLSLRMEADADGVRLDPGRILRTDRAFLSLGAQASAADYFDAAARENAARTRRKPLAGWSSWYYYYSAVTQSDLEKNTDTALRLRASLPLQLIQLDDGYQAEVGDWFERNAKFPSPLTELSSKIRKAGFTPGIWISPFLIRQGSRTAEAHPDWLVPKAQGVMSNIHPAWVRETRSLDVTRPEVMDHVRKIIRTAVKDWRFPFLKLDFLYIPAVKGARLADPTVTRAQALRNALEQVRAAAGEKTYLLGCGCPLGSGIGIFDGMRIGPDVDSIWKPHLFRRTWLGRGDPTLPAAWNAVRNMFARAPLHRRWWWNDPDCLVVRDAETRLSRDERRTLTAAIALSGGMVLLSDNLPALSPDAVRMAQILFPPIYRAAEQPAWRGDSPASLLVLPMRGPQGKWWVVGIFNWGDRPVDRRIDLKKWIGVREEAVVFSFWDEQFLDSPKGKLELKKIPAHGSILLAVRPKESGAQFVGSNIHFSQGVEVAGWKTARKSLRAVFSMGREAEGAVWISLPNEPTSVQWGGRSVEVSRVVDSIWKIPVALSGRGKMEIRWK